ncbi:MAG: type I secretion system permease/ATPase [Paracoccaceae bacterium]|nr:type I secretion system permease/ATPase [Paracoccaceae bacterium]
MSAPQQSKSSNPLNEALRASRYLLVVAFAFSVFVNFLMLTGPLFMLQVYDRVLGSRSEETLVALLALVLFLFGLMWLLDFARTRLIGRFGARLQMRLDGRVFRSQLQRADRMPNGASPSRDLETLQAFYASPALTAMMDAPFTPLFVAVMFIFHPLLGWFAVVAALVLVAITLLNQVLTAHRLYEAQQTVEIGHRFADNARRAREIIRSQGMLGPVTERFLARRIGALTRSMEAIDLTGAFSTFTKVFRLALQSMVLAVGAWLVLGGEITAGAMIAGSILLGRALAPIEQLIGRWTQITRARQARRALSTFLAEAPDAMVRTRLPRPEGRLDVTEVTYAPVPGKPPILAKISFSVEPGEALGVIGRSGSGKTSIAKTILGLLPPTLGEVRLGGALIDHYSAEDLGAHVGYLPQDPMLITGTISENIARMSLEPDSAKVVEAAQKAKAHELILSLPEGYDSRVEDNEIALSGGQRQRIALARALYGDPVLLVLDEPNSALDHEGSDALNKAIRTMKAEGRSVIVMTHRPVAISECDRLMVVDQGQVKAIGPRDEIVKSMMKNASDVRRVIGGAAGS